MKIINNMAERVEPLSNPFVYNDSGSDDYDDLIKLFNNREASENKIDDYIAGTQSTRGLNIAIPSSLERKISKFVSSPWGGRIYEGYVSRGAPINNDLAERMWDYLIRYGECVIIKTSDDIYVEKTSSAMPSFDSHGRVDKVLYRDEFDVIYDVSDFGEAFYFNIYQPIFGASTLKSIDRLYTISSAGILAAEVFHSPARYLMNVDGDEVIDTTAAIGRTIVIGPPPEGEPEAKVQELAGGDPKIFNELAAAESSRLALASGIPPQMLNTSILTNMSYESVLLSEKSFVDRVRSIQNIVTAAMETVGMDRPVFGYIQQQQLSQTADGIYKLISAGVLAADSDFVARALQMSASEREDNRNKLNDSSPVLKGLLTSALGVDTGVDSEGALGNQGGSLEERF